MPIVKFTNAGVAGLNLDVEPNDLAISPAVEWSGGGNVRFNDGYTEKFLGHSAVNGTPSVTPYGVFFTNNAARYEVYTGLTKIYAVTGSTHTDITRALGDYTGTSSDKWNGSTLAGTLILNNGVDDPQFWAGVLATPCAKLTNWPANTKAKIIRTLDNFIIALNITESGTNYPSMVRWSTPADPGSLPASWDYTLATNDSGRVEGVLSSTPDKIVDGLALGNTFMIYKENSTYSMQYVGGTDIFRFASVSKTSGALGIDCAASFPGGHAVLADGDIVLNQGGATQSIIDRRMRRWLFNNIDSDNRQRSFTVPNLRRNEVWFCFPQLGQTWPDKALIWNYKDNTWGVRDIPNLTHANAGVIAAASSDTWDSRTEVWDDADGIWAVDEYSQATPRVMMASSDGGLFLADISRSFNGSPMTSYIERTGLDFGAPESRKLCKGVRPRFDAAEGTVIRVYVGAQSDLDGAITWSPAVNFTVGTSLKADLFVSGRYLAVKFESVAQGAWRLKSFDMDIEIVGDY